MSVSTKIVPPSPPRAGLAATALKLAVTVLLYVAVFYWVDAGTLIARLRGVELGWVVLGTLAYVVGQWASAWRWWILLAPVELAVPYLRMVAFYFIGMFFNIFLPTIVGGDAVKALFLARETGAPARAVMSVFMERNTGLVALFGIATIAARFAPPVELLGFSIPGLVLVLFAAFLAANLVIATPRAYRFVDHLIALTPLARLRSRASSLYEAVVPYRGAYARLGAALGLSFFFQAVVILVVFLNAKALAEDVPLAALAVFVPLISLAGMLPISVNGLGVREALYLLLLGRIGVPADAAVSMALLYFIVTVTASLPGGMAYALLNTPALKRE
ncbi:MAG: lysylphosphatidylglycerol synthase transmembrane domain-containing protein [Acidobacteriota bacterium]